MKAKEYYDKYSATILTNPQTIPNLLMAFNTDTREICEKRHAVQNTAVVAVLREQNGKWNALVRLFQKANVNGKSPIKENGFKIFWLKRMPELKELWT